MLWSSLLRTWQPPSRLLSSSSSPLLAYPGQPFHLLPPSCTYRRRTLLIRELLSAWRSPDPPLVWPWQLFPEPDFLKPRLSLGFAVPLPPFFELLRGNPSPFPSRLCCRPWPSRPCRDPSQPPSVFSPPRLSLWLPCPRPLWPSSVAPLILIGPSLPASWPFLCVRPLFSILTGFHSGLVFSLCFLCLLGYVL